MRTKSLTTLFFMTFILFSAGCQSTALQAANDLNDNLTQEAATQERLSTADGVTLTTEKDVYSITADKIIVEIKNDSSIEYMTGIHVFLEKKEDNIWYRVPMKADSFTEAGLIHPPGEVTQMDFDVDSLKYELTPGQYRATINGLGAPFEIVE